MDVRDQVYCFEIARRAVGRAAVHLGIETMTEEALNTLADILLSYLNNLGRRMSHLVEASGRTSAHVNILDAFQAVELVSAPVVQRLHLMEQNQLQQQGVGGIGSPTDELNLANASKAAAAAVAAVSTTATTGTSGDGTNGGNTPSGNNNNNSSSNTSGSSSTSVMGDPGWRGLAAFCFGPKWHEKKSDDDENNDVLTARGGGGMGGGAGGKRGPSAILNEEEAIQKINKAGGWEAPYLDEVPFFPQAATTCANPHPLPPHVGLSLHNDIPDDELQQLLLGGGPTTTGGSASARAHQQERTQQLVHAADQDLANIPDTAFTTWGSLGGSTSKRKRSELHKDTNTTSGASGGSGSGSQPTTGENSATDKKDNATSNSSSSASPPSKKVKLDDGTAADSAGAAGSNNSGGTKAAGGKNGSDTADKKKAADKKKSPATPDDKGKGGSTNPKGSASKNKKKKSNAATAEEDEEMEIELATQLRKKKEHNLPYVPCFYPPAPIHKLASTGRTVVDKTTTSSAKSTAAARSSGLTSGSSGLAGVGTTMDDTSIPNKNPDVTAASRTATSTTHPLGASSSDIIHDVRSSLVQLGHYWGSGWESRETSTSDSAIVEVQVPLGRTEVVDQQGSTTTVVPLVKASGSRVSRILEGSMDAAAMQ